MKTKVVKVGEVKIESLIKKNFSEEFMKKIYDVYSDDYMSIVEKTIIFDRIFTEEFGHRKDYRRIGEGTNRFVCLLDNHIIKVAYNYLAYIDNMNELAQSKHKSKYLAQAYETNGIILVSEYVTVMDKMEFLESQFYIKKILDILAIDEKKRQYILGDMGMSEKNYGNWGRRMNGDIVVLDYGYLYELTNAEWKEVAKCPTCGSSLEYTKDYSELKCVKPECGTEVKYTTLRNTFGYGDIINNINKNINEGKYIKFDNGEINVDVMDVIEIEEEKKEEFKMPDEIVNKIEKAKDTFFLIAEKIQKDYELNLDMYYELEKLIKEERNEYDELLYPFVLAALDMNIHNVDKYIKDFNKFSNARYEKMYKELKGEFEKEEQKSLEELEDIPDNYEEFEGYTVKGYESELKIIDRQSKDGEDAVIQTSLDEIFGSEFDMGFNNLFNAEDVNEIDDSEINEYSLEHIMSLINENEKLNAEEKIEEERKQKEKEQLDAEYELYMAEKELEKAYDLLEDALTQLISNKYNELGCLYEDEDDYVTGDIRRTYLNGDFIDLDYSPRINAKNILGGWKPNEFAFPLYRHLLIKFDYDDEIISGEFQAIYRVEDEVEVPEDLYGKVENRNYVVNQIMNRFEDSMKPARHTIIMNIGGELNDYYKALDDYYDLIKSDESDVSIDDPDYYLSLSNNSDQITKLLREARSDLKDDLLDDGYVLENLLDKYKIVYYYDLEAIMNMTELNIVEIIQDMDLRSINNIKEYILNEYYIRHNAILPDSAFDIFKYGASIQKEDGCQSHPRIIRPAIRAKLVDKNSNDDTFKPEVFNKAQYKIINIEQRYDLVINMNNPEEITVMNDVKLSMNQRNIVYKERLINKYVVKKSKDNMRYGLTEKEISLVEEFENMLSASVIEDVDNLVKKHIVEIMDEKYNLCNETKEFMNDLANSDLSEAYANRLMKITIMEMNGYKTRLDYLTHVE